MHAHIDSLAERLRLSPYQAYVVTQNGYKYNLGKLKKFGEMVYAPYKCGLPRSFRDGIAKLLFGPRADLIGIDRMIAYDERKIDIRKIIRGR